MPLLTVFSEALAKGWTMARDALVEPDALTAIRLTLIVAAIAVPLNMISGSPRPGRSPSSIFMARTF